MIEKKTETSYKLVLELEIEKKPKEIIEKKIRKNPKKITLEQLAINIAGEVSKEEEAKGKIEYALPGGNSSGSVDAEVTYKFKEYYSKETLSYDNRTEAKKDARSDAFDNLKSNEYLVEFDATIDGLGQFTFSRKNE